MNRKILIVDDEADIVELVSYNLKKEGFEVEAALDGEEALKKINADTYTLLVLDLMLPGIQGMELCRIIRNNPKTNKLPIIMLTAKGEELDRVLGLEIGADDYMTKPFSPRELAARIKAVLRRTREKENIGADAKPVAQGVIRLGDLSIDRETYTVTKKGDKLNLSATEFKLFLYLAERKGRVFSRDQLLDAIWRDEAFVEPRTVDVHIRRLRTQVEDDPANPVYIKTRRGIGYYVEPGS
ncbi:MAG: response regulator transcription factor [Nitrospirae bacterium]|nr:MAG: response regulator transcription factor [Nitrospirota bacterium]